MTLLSSTVRIGGGSLSGLLLWTSDGSLVTQLGELLQT